MEHNFKKCFKEGSTFRKRKLKFNYLNLNIKIDYSAILIL